METATASVLQLDNGGLATLRVDYFRPETAPTHGDDRLRLAGTKGIVEYQASTGVTLMTADDAAQSHIRTAARAVALHRLPERDV